MDCHVANAPRNDMTILNQKYFTTSINRFLVWYSFVQHDSQKMINIRPATEFDFDEIYRIFKSVIAGENTYVNRADTTKEEVHAKWMDKKSKSFVAEIPGEVTKKIVGVYLIKPNQVDLGSHIANASYIVDENTRGAGVGKALALHSIAKAKELGYRAMQFNFVASTNEAAVNL